MAQQNVSHGRGGVANIGKDVTPYSDGEIVREGPTGDQGDGAFSVGRGGRGNIGSPKVSPASHGSDHDVVPEAATRIVEEQNHHIGRGGEGNVRIMEKKDHPSDTKGMADKLKQKVLGDKHE